MAMLYIATQPQHKSNVRRLSGAGPNGPSAGDLARDLGLNLGGNRRIEPLKPKMRHRSLRRAKASDSVLASV
ncbi:MAG: hypothetical protein WBE80_01640 [Methylocella sp.]